MYPHSVFFSELFGLLDSELEDQTLNPELVTWIGRLVITLKGFTKTFATLGA